MAGEGTTTDVKDQQGASAGAGGAAGGDKTADKGATQAGAKAGEQQGKPGDKSTATSAGSGGGPKRHALGADDDDIPDDAELLELSKTALTKRLNRHTKAQLRKAFGTDDVEQVAKDLSDYRKLKGDQEKARQAELSDVEREKDRANRAEARAKDLEARVRGERTQRRYERYDSKLSRVAEAVLDADYVGAELNRFARHLTDAFDRKQLRRMSGEQTAEELKKFLEQRVKDKPKIARDYEDKRREEIRDELKKEARGERRSQAVTNGADHGKKPSQEGNGNGEQKTFAPGRANSMSDKEARAEMKRLGISYR
jgi:hypothetical protein